MHWRHRVQGDPTSAEGVLREPRGRGENDETESRARQEVLRVGGIKATEGSPRAGCRPAGGRMAARPGSVPTYVTWAPHAASVICRSFDDFRQNPGIAGLWA